MYENRRYIIITAEEAKLVSFHEVHETSIDSLRYSLDGTKTFVKYDITEVTESYDVEVPDPETMESVTQTIDAGIYGRPSIFDGHTEYEYDDFLALLQGSDWNNYEEAI